MPADEVYYNTTEGWVRDINPEQYIREDTSILEAMDRLQSWPFLLIDENMNRFAIIDEETGESIMMKTVENQEQQIDTTEFLNTFDFDRYGFESEDVRIHPTIDYYDDKFTLGENHESLVTEYDQRYQIITIADMNSRRVKDMLYQSFAELVANLGEKIEERYAQPDEILKVASPKAVGRWKKDQIKGMNLHIAEHINLIDMLQVLQGGDSDFVKECGFESKDDVSTLSHINDIRNRVMHANKSLIHNRQDIEDVLEAVRETKRITSNMS